MTKGLVAGLFWGVVVGGALLVGAALQLDAPEPDAPSAESDVETDVQPVAELPAQTEPAPLPTAPRQMAAPFGGRTPLIPRVDQTQIQLGDPHPKIEVQLPLPLDAAIVPPAGVLAMHTVPDAPAWQIGNDDMIHADGMATGPRGMTPVAGLRTADPVGSAPTVLRLEAIGNARPPTFDLALPAAPSQIPQISEQPEVEQAPAIQMSALEDVSATPDQMLETTAPAPLPDIASQPLPEMPHAELPKVGAGDGPSLVFVLLEPLAGRDAPDWATAIIEDGQVIDPHSAALLAEYLANPGFSEPDARRVMLPSPSAGVERVMLERQGIEVLLPYRVIETAQGISTTLSTTVARAQRDGQAIVLVRDSMLLRAEISDWLAQADGVQIAKLVAAQK